MVLLPVWRMEARYQCWSCDGEFILFWLEQLPALVASLEQLPVLVALRWLSAVMHVSRDLWSSVGALRAEFAPNNELKRGLC